MEKNLRESILGNKENLQSTYFPALTNGKKYSKLIEEMCGSKQGGVKSAVDYKSYNSPLYHLIEWSGLGMKIGNKKFGSVIVADDALSMTTTIPQMKGIVELYEYFTNIYSVDYCVKKNHGQSVWKQPSKEGTDGI